MANWYYVVEGQQQGPVEEDVFRQLVAEGRVTDDTLVWNETMTAWQPYRAVRLAAEAGTANPAPTSGTLVPDRETGASVCAECGRTFPPDELIPIGGRWICAHCKPLALQKMQENVAPVGGMRYAGFWIRVAARLLDSLIMIMVSLVVQLVVPAIFLGIASATGSKHELMGIMGAVVAGLVQMGLAIGYSVFFWGRFGATPGKMICGIKVVRSDGSPITYMRALGRVFGDMLSGMTLGIGYLIVASDPEKRALHDHICDTRVVYR